MRSVNRKLGITDTDVTMRKVVAITVFVLVVLSASGCGDKSGLRGVSPEQARQLNGERSAFEKSEDPPINAQTYFAAGMVAESHNDFASAAAQYVQVLAKVGADAPERKVALYRLGVCQSHLKKYSEAIATWKQYVEANEGEAGAYSNLGFCFELAGQIEQAEATYRKGVERDPKNAACRTNFGLMLARMGRMREAAEQLGAVLSEAEVHYNLGSVMESQGRREGAKVEYRRALEVDPEFNEASERLVGLR